MEMQINFCSMSNSWAFEEANVRNPMVSVFSLSLSLFYEFNMEELIES